MGYSGMLLIMHFFQISKKCPGICPESFPCFPTDLRHSVMGLIFLVVLSPPIKMHQFIKGRICTLIIVLPNPNQFPILDILRSFPSWHW